MEDYVSINKHLWNEKTKVHIHSDFYNNEKFKQTKTSLNANELKALGNVSGKLMLHLQCHFGQDTLSWQHLGAHCTGIDLSDEAISYAQQLNKELLLNAEFICCDIYDLKSKLDTKFDIVFTSYGTIGWLPDLDKWAAIITHFLKPGGTFYMIDFHPVLWMFDNDFKFFEYSYFNTQPIVENLEGTYADKNAPLKNSSISWNHPLNEIINALIKQGLQLDYFNEFDYSNYNCFNNTVETEIGKFMIKGLEKKLPIMYELKFIKS